jgi:peptide/nickel transport system ATP-binding protein
VTADIVEPVADTAGNDQLELEPASGALLSVRDLSVTFPTEDGDLHAVRGVSYDVYPGEVFGIVGESGSGKSVSTMALMGLLPKTAHITGSARFRDRQLIDGSDIRDLRGRKIAMIFQDPMTSLNPVYTIGFQLAEAVQAHHRIPRNQAVARAVEMLDLVGIPQAKSRADAYPHEFSGGMRQRVMIAMAIINNPDLLIADEPTTALDVTVQAQILEMLVEVKDQVNAAIILITHDLGVIAGMADRVNVMYAGRVVESGTAEQIFDTPRMPYAAGLLGSIPSARSSGEVLTPIQGAPPNLIRAPDGCPFQPRCPIAVDECGSVEPALEATDQDGHAAACIRWEHLASVEDPRALFRAALIEKVAASEDAESVDDDVAAIVDDTAASGRQD